MAGAINARHTEKLERDLRFAGRTLERMRAAVDAEGRCEAYIQFYRVFKVAADLLVAIAKDGPSGRGLSHRIRNSMLSDPILKYLIVSRNVEDHATETSNPLASETKGGAVLVNRAILVDSVGKLTIENSDFGNGIINGSISVSQGKIVKKSGNLAIEFVGGDLLLNPVVDQNGREHKPPLHLLEIGKRADVFFCEYAGSVAQIL